MLGTKASRTVLFTKGIQANKGTDTRLETLKQRSRRDFKCHLVQPPAEYWKFTTIFPSPRPLPYVQKNDNLA